MHASYVIQWKSKSNGRSGMGTKRFDMAEAERLAAELNREYPQIEHAAVPASSAPEPVATEQEEEVKEPSEEEEEEAPTAEREEAP